MEPKSVNVGSVSSYVPPLLAEYVMVAPVGAVTFAQLCALPLYVSFFVPALILIHAHWAYSVVSAILSHVRADAPAAV